MACRDPARPQPSLIDITTTDAGDGAVPTDDTIFLGVEDQQENNAPMNGPVLTEADGDPDMGQSAG